jgi:SOS-response transcriptional repressor LexA
MNYGNTLAKLRKEKGYTQTEVAEYISRFSEKPCSFKVVSHWENGVSSPPVEQFLLMCEFYEVGDILKTFRGIDFDKQSIKQLNTLGRSRVKEYVSMLMNNPLFCESDDLQISEPQRRYMKLYYVPAAAGSGVYLDSEYYDELEVDETMPADADFAVKVSGDSMEPRYIDGQIVFIKEQQTLEIGEIGIFELNGDSYIKRLGLGELISLNTSYEPITINEYDSFRIFGKVVG